MSAASNPKVIQHCSEGGEGEFALRVKKYCKCSKTFGSNCRYTKSAISNDPCCSV